LAIAPALPQVLEKKNSRFKNKKKEIEFISSSLKDKKILSTIQTSDLNNQI